MTKLLGVLLLVLLVGCSSDYDEQYPEVVADGKEQCLKYGGVRSTWAQSTLRHDMPIKVKHYCVDGTELGRRVRRVTE